MTEFYPGEMSDRERFECTVLRYETSSFGREGEYIYANKNDFFVINPFYGIINGPETICKLKGVASR